MVEDRARRAAMSVPDKAGAAAKDTAGDTSRPAQESTSRHSSASSPETTPRPADPQPRGRCLLCEEAPAEIRGQCRRCRQGTRRDIAAGRLTEQELIDKGLLLPSAQGRRKTKPPWRRRLEQVLPEQ